MRPAIKVTDRVRFRTDGEIGEYNRIYGHDKVSPLYVHEVSADGAWVGLDERTVDSKVDLLWQVPSILLDICNDPIEKLAPAFKVGDWVELTDGLQCRLTECLNPNSGHWLAKEVDGSKVSVWEKNSVRTIARTIQKSEVKVKAKVTLEGTVTNITNNTESFLMWHGENPDKHAEIIRYADLDPATAELVRELVAKQEEK